MFRWKQGDSRWSRRTQISLTCGPVSTCTTTSSKRNIEPLRLAHSHFLVGFCIRRQSPSQSFVPLDQRSENEGSGNNHFRHAPEVQTAQWTGWADSVISFVISKWLLPELSFSDRWSFSEGCFHLCDAFPFLPSTSLSALLSCRI